MVRVDELSLEAINRAIANGNRESVVEGGKTQAEALRGTRGRFGGGGLIEKGDSPLDQEALYRMIQELLGRASKLEETQDGLLNTFFQDSAPALFWMGDFWFDTNDNMTLYRASGDYNTGGTWELSDDQSLAESILAIAEAQATADGKIRTFFQTTPPAMTQGKDIGDLWVDTDDQNHVWRWNGTAWQSTRDGKIQVAQDTADSAVGRLDAFGADGFISADEVPGIQDERLALEQIKTAALAQAVTLGLPTGAGTPHKALVDAWAALVAYLDPILATALSSAKKAAIDRAEWRATWQAAYTAETNLQGAMAKLGWDALQKFADAEADGKLTEIEKGPYRDAWTIALAEKAGIDSTSDRVFGGDTSKRSAYDTAYAALDAVKANWTSTGTTDISAISPAIKTRWETYWNERQALLDAINDFKLTDDERILSDNWLSRAEKPALINRFEVLQNRVQGLFGKADANQVDRSALTSAWGVLSASLNGLTPAWNDTTQHTPLGDAAAAFWSPWTLVEVEADKLTATLAMTFLSVDVAALTNLPLSGTGSPSADGWTLTNNCLVMLTGQTTLAENAVYRFTATSSSSSATVRSAAGVESGTGSYTDDANTRDGNTSTYATITATSGTTTKSVTYSGFNGPGTSGNLVLIVEPVCQRTPIGYDYGDLDASGSVSYSLDGGATWTNLADYGPDDTGQKTFSIPISGILQSRIQVRVDATANKGRYLDDQGLWFTKTSEGIMRVVELRYDAAGSSAGYLLTKTDTLKTGQTYLIRNGSTWGAKSATVSVASNNAITLTLASGVLADVLSAQNNLAGKLNIGDQAADAAKLGGQLPAYFQPASTAITTANIGSQSVSYATSAGSAPASDVYAWAKSPTKPGYLYTEVGAAPASHAHAVSEVTGLQTALDGKQASLGYTPISKAGDTGIGNLSFGAPGARNIKIDSTIGSISIRTPAPGGFAVQYGFNASDDVTVNGGFGVYGTGGAVIYHYIGPDYANPLLKVSPVGFTTIRDSLQADGGAITANSAASTPYFELKNAGVRRFILLNNSTGSSTQFNMYDSSGVLIDTAISITNAAGGQIGFASNRTVSVGTLTSSGGVLLTGSTTTDGSISYNAAAGLKLVGKAGSSYDASLLAAGSASYVWRVPTGTNQLQVVGPMTTLSTLTCASDLATPASTVHAETYSVPISTYVPINLAAGVTALAAGKAYHVRLVTTTTGASTGATYLVYQTAATPTFAIKLISNNGTSSNNPQLRINVAGNGLEVYHNHPSSTYPIHTIVTTYSVGNVTILSPNFFGLEGALTRTDTGLSTSDAFSCGALTATSASITDVCTAGSFRALSSSGTDGSMSFSDSVGLKFLSKTGTTYDASLLTPGATLYVWRVPTGTNNIEFSGNVSMGALTATSGNFSGVVKIMGGSSLGLTFRSNIVQTEEHNGPDSINFNYRGYLNGTTQFRNFRVYDGKQAYIMDLDGGTKAATFAGALTAATGTFSGQLTAAGGAFSGTTYISNRVGLSYGGVSANAAVYVGGGGVPTGISGTTQYGLLVNSACGSDGTAGYISGYFQARTQAASFNVAALRGVYIDNPNMGAGSSATTAYGLYINTQSAGTTNYAIYTSAGLLRFGDAATFTSTVSTGALTSTTGTFSGQLSMATTGNMLVGTTTGAATTAVSIRAAAGQSRGVQFASAAVARWYIEASSAAETGIDAGSALRVLAYTDAGSPIDAVLTITRASGGTIAWSTARPMTMGALTATSVYTPQIAGGSGANDTLILGGATPLRTGRSGTGFPVLSYNANANATANTYTYAANDVIWMLDFGNASSFRIRYAGSGTAGNTATFTDYFKLSDAGALTLTGALSALSLSVTSFITLNRIGAAAAADIFIYADASTESYIRHYQGGSATTDLKWKVGMDTSGNWRTVLYSAGSVADVPLSIAPTAGGAITFVSTRTVNMGPLVATTGKFTGNVGFNNVGPIAKPTVSGSRGGNAALASLLTALESYGLITNSSTA